MEDKRKEVLDQVKLVPAENMLDSVSCYVYLQDVIDEGIRSAFGMRTKDAIILRLAHDLRLALQSAEKAEELERKVKGLQLENGRLKAKVDKLHDELSAEKRRYDNLRAETYEQNETKSAESGADA